VDRERQREIGGSNLGRLVERSSAKSDLALCSSAGKFWVFFFFVSGFIGGLLGVDSLGVCVAGSCACGCGGHGGEAVVVVAVCFLIPSWVVGENWWCSGAGWGERGLGKGREKRQPGR